MAVYAQFDEEGECIQLASNSGWSDFGDWTETLKNFPRITKLFESGECEEITELRADLEKALEDSPPKEKDIEDVAHQVIHAIDAGGKADILLITAGVKNDVSEEETA